MRRAGHDVEVLSCDDLLEVKDVGKDAQAVDIFYIMAHGTFDQAGYSVLLHAADWQPAVAGLGGAPRLTVAIFDTCKLLDSARVPNWRAVWAVAGIGPHLRLLLGFDGPAVIDRESALRGLAFAEDILAGVPFARAWVGAVAKTCGHSQYRRAVAIGIGNSPADAQVILDTASLANMPGPRGPGLHMEARY
jgi:hypothetical protein